MTNLAHIKRCLDLSDRDVAAATGDRSSAKALLDHLAKISKPGEGGPKLLLVFAKLAAEQADWIDGALRVELIGDVQGTVVEVLSEMGAGMHERVFPSFKMSVPLEEFLKAVERVPRMIEPLAVATRSPRRMVLTAQEPAEKPSMLPSVEIADESLYEVARQMKRGALENPVPTRIENAPPAPPPRKGSAPKHRAVKRRSNPDLSDAASTRGRTLRPMAPAPFEAIPKALPPLPFSAKISDPPPSSKSSKPPKRKSGKPPQAIGRAFVPKAPPLPRTDDDDEPAKWPEEEPSSARVLARVALTKVAAPRAPQAAKRASKAPPGRASKPPAKRGSIKPASRASNKPPRGSGGGKAAPRARSSEPPVDDVDRGWDEPE